MKTIKGPGIFLAQFADDQAPFNTLEEWPAGQRNWDLWRADPLVGQRGCST